KAFTAGRARHISGISVSANRLTIRLRARSPSFLGRIATPFFCAVPVGTPLDPAGVPEIPSAGPYYVASELPGQQLVLRRNPNYHGARPRQFEQIAYTSGIATPGALAEPEPGRIDYSFDGAPPSPWGRLDPRYAPDSPAAKRGRQQLFSMPQPTVWALYLNAGRPLFR